MQKTKLRRIKQESCLSACKNYLYSYSWFFVYSRRSLSVICYDILVLSYSQNRSISRVSVSFTHNLAIWIYYPLFNDSLSMLFHLILERFHQRLWYVFVFGDFLENCLTCSNELIFRLLIFILWHLTDACSPAHLDLFLAPDLSLWRNWNWFIYPS